MSEARSGSAERLAKVVLVGSPRAGKAEILKAVAERYAHGSVRAGEIGEGTVLRTEFLWPVALCDGARLRIRLFAVSGHPVYNAVSELVLAGADGIVLAVSLARDGAAAAREALQALVSNARQNGLDLAVLPAGLFYYRPVPLPVLEPGAMDQWLGIPPGSVPCFVGGPDEPENMRAPVEWIVTQIAARWDHPPAPTEAGELEGEPSRGGEKTALVQRTRRKRKRRRRQAEWAESAR